MLDTFVRELKRDNPAVMVSRDVFSRELLAAYDRQFLS
jgi:hypothetical protein